MSSGVVSRKERQAATRKALIDAAGRVFGREGLRAPLDAVAAEAGYTKGAVYANFRSKEELFLELLDDRLARRLERMREIYGGLSSVEDLFPTVRRGSDDFVAYVDADPEWDRLFFEAAVFAARDEAFRVALEERYARMRSAMATLFAELAGRLGFELPLPAERIAAMFFAAANGVALDRLVSPGADERGDLFAELTTTLVTGLLARGAQGEGGAR